MLTFIKRLFNPPKPCGLGCIPSPKDDRDIPHKIDEYAKLAAGEGTQLPINYSMADLIGPILNQGKTNSCTGHAATYFMNCLISRTLNKHKENFKLNPYFNYYWARYFSGLGSADNGAYLRGALKALTKKGVWVCNMWRTDQVPPKDYSDDSSTFKLKGYEYVHNRDSDSLKTILAIEKLPLYISLNVIYDDINMYTGEIKAEDKFDNSKSSGYHAMCVIGYETRKDGVWYQTANSWGTVNFGDNGFAWIHESYFKNPLLITEIWTATKQYF